MRIKGFSGFVAATLRGVHSTSETTEFRTESKTPLTFVSFVLFVPFVISRCWFKQNASNTNSTNETNGTNLTYSEVGAFGTTDSGEMLLTVESH